MYGVAGILSPDAVPRALLLAMTRRIAHCEPDDERSWIDAEAGIGFGQGETPEGGWRGGFGSEKGTVMWSWTETKELIEHSIGFSLDSLHVIAGVLILLAAALLLRKPVSTMRPWLVVLVLACANEFIDLSYRWPSPSIQFGESIKDLLLTMLLPTVLLLASRIYPRIFESGGLAEGEPSQSGD